MGVKKKIKATCTAMSSILDAASKITESRCCRATRGDLKWLVGARSQAEIKRHRGGVGHEKPHYRTVITGCFAARVKRGSATSVQHWCSGSASITQLHAFVHEICGFHTLQRFHSSSFCVSV